MSIQRKDPLCSARAASAPRAAAQAARSTSSPRCVSLTESWAGSPRRRTWPRTSREGSRTARASAGVRAPRALAGRVVELSDPAVPTSRQPYHAVMGAAGAASRRVEERLLRVVTGATERSIRELLERYRDAGHAIRAAALVVGSVIDPARIANDHIRAHALEGALFRTALATAASAVIVSPR